MSVLFVIIGLLVWILASVMYGLHQIGDYLAGHTVKTRWYHYILFAPIFIWAWILTAIEGDF